MRISINTSKWYDNIWAAFIFFTRLPFWRIYQPPRECYRTVVEHWPLTGWLTGGIMAAVLYFGSMILPYSIAIVLAIASRMLLTGALHEDGLCDFFDGFGGGGNDRQRILDIMKDSRIGTYGVLGMIIYTLILFFSLSSLSPSVAALTILAADPYAKMVAGQIIMMMPYARTEEESKAKTVYRRINIKAGISLAIQGLLPIVAYIYYMHDIIDWQYLIFIPCVVMYFLYLLIWRKLRGYTGDCCGALFLLVELAVYLTVASTIYI
ncbi:MAG: adenosylcobinamide-GDP ribazoletransferase [Prevotellaceae bacterium]|nr:adenosylcobinamide-GDP ribazoletransferase [Prevotellaceae bacterium]